MNRVLDHAARVQAKIDAGGQDGRLRTAEQRAALESTLNNDMLEHHAYQNRQAAAHAAGILTTDEAQTIYAALGEVPAADGWAKGTSLALKVTITNLMGELMGVEA